MKWLSIFITAHLVGVFLYQNFGDPQFLYINLLTIGYALYQFIRVGVLVLSPNWDVELAYATHIPYRWKLLHNAVQGVSIYMFYVVGWDFIAGFATLYLTIITIAIMITVLNVDMTEFDGDDE